MRCLIARINKQEKDRHILAGLSPVRKGRGAVSHLYGRAGGGGRRGGDESTRYWMRMRDCGVREGGRWQVAEEENTLLLLKVLAETMINKLYKILCLCSQLF